MKHVIFVSPSPKVMGGISTVINGYFDASLGEHYRIKIVVAHKDGSKVKKFIVAALGLVTFLFLLTTSRVDVVHIHCGDIPSPNRKYFYFLLSRLYKKKSIMHFHGSLFMEQYPKASTFWQKRLSRMFQDVDLVICLSESWRKDVLTFAPKAKTAVLPNGVFLPQGLKERKAWSDNPRLTFLGLIGERKGVFLLLKVFKKLLEEFPKAVLNIGGNGDVERLYKVVEQTNLSDNVKYLGWIGPEARDALLKESDIFILPSYGEGMPMSVLEAMSYALPVVSTTVGGIPELVRNEVTGILTSPGDEEGLYQALRLLCNDPGLSRKMGQSGFETIAAEYEVSGLVKRLQVMYENL